jgi:beta-N-acetylhexosaminidase
MVAHLAVPSLTESNTPASIAPEVIDVARTELGFEGLLISDAVVMDGLSQVLDGRSPAVAVVEAGADVVLAPADPVAAREALLSAVESGRIAEERINASVRRILRIKLDRGILVPEGEVFDRRFRHVRGLDPKQVLAAPEHVTLVQTIMTRAAEARGAVAAP